MSTVDTVAFLGGERVFGRPLVSESDLAEEIVRGFPFAALDMVVRTLVSDLISQTSIYEIVSAVRMHHVQNQLSREESGRLARLARVAVRAVEALGSTEKGLRWLAIPNRALDGRRPLELLAAEEGSKLVEDVLGRIEHGVIT